MPVKRCASLLFIAAIMSSLSIGCASEYRVQVNSINDPKIELGSKYILHSGMDGVADNDLEFREYAVYIHRALSARGYEFVESETDADIMILVRYGIGDPRTQSYSFSNPTHGLIGGVTGTYNSTTLGGSSGTFYTNPTFGKTGTSTTSVTIMTYYRFLVLDAIVMSTYQEGVKLVPVWKTTAKSRGISSDLRKVFPVLVGASQEHIGTNTGNQITIELRENDERITTILGETVPQ